MTVAQAVHAIESVGGRVRLKGDRIHYRIPDPAPKPVAEAVEVPRRHKPEAFQKRQHGERANTATLEQLPLPLVGEL